MTTEAEADRRGRDGGGTVGRALVLSLILCFACPLPGAPGQPGASAFVAREAQACGSAAAGAPAAATAEPRRDEERRRCRGGRDAIAFGRKLIEYGMATLEYAAGLLLVVLGALFVAMGWLISVLELVWC